MLSITLRRIALIAAAAIDYAAFASDFDARLFMLSLALLSFAVSRFHELRRFYIRLIAPAARYAAISHATLIRHYCRRGHDIRRHAITPGH